MFKLRSKFGKFLITILGFASTGFCLDDYVSSSKSSVKYFIGTYTATRDCDIPLLIERELQIKLVDQVYMEMLSGGFVFLKTPDINKKYNYFDTCLENGQIGFEKITFDNENLRYEYSLNAPGSECRGKRKKTSTLEILMKNQNDKLVIMKSYSDKVYKYSYIQKCILNRR